VPSSTSELGYQWQDQDEVLAGLNRIVTESDSDWEVVVDRIQVVERRYRQERHL
jgi:hypothetical protein